MEKKIPLLQRYGIMNRRSFLRLSGLLGLGLASARVLPAAAETVRFDRKKYKVSKTSLAMGTFVSMTLVHSSRDKAEEAMGKAFEEIERLAGLMNRFDETTAISRLNREGSLKDIPLEVAEVVGRALDYYRFSHGIFDVSVKPVVDLFKERSSGGKSNLPSEKELEQVLGLVGANNIELRGRSLRFKNPGMGITLDGIAKGYIVDRASLILVAHNITDHLVNSGGDIRAMGSAQNGKPWTVAIQDPKGKECYPDIIQITDGAIATSGDYEVFFDREKIFHHIVDPRSGLSPELTASVSVSADTAMNADALSTTVFLMNPVQGAKFIDSNTGCECLIISKKGKRFTSAGWTSAAV